MAEVASGLDRTAGQGMRCQRTGTNPNAFQRICQDLSNPDSIKMNVKEKYPVSPDESTS